MLIKCQGGQIDLEEATRCAHNIINWCEKRGPPFVLFNVKSKALEYLNTEDGIREARMVLLTVCKVCEHAGSENMHTYGSTHSLIA